MTSSSVQDDILITHVSVLSCTADRKGIIADYFVRIRDGLIIETGPMSALSKDIQAQKNIDGHGDLLMPGLVNTHTHAAMTLFRGLADDLPLMTWLHEHIFPAEAKTVTPEMVYWCSRLAAQEMVRAGITTAADGYFHEDEAARAFADTGIRGVMGQGVLDFPAPGVPDPADNVAYAGRFIDDWQGKNELITPAVFCHSPYICSSETLVAAKEMARQKGALFFTHVAETQSEVDQMQQERGVTPVRLLFDLGILDRDTVCVHCVWVDDADREILANSGAGVAICTASNMKLASGIAPLVEMLALKVSLGLGTDGCASNNILDIFQEMNLTAKLHKVHNLDPTVLPASSLLDMATRGGAKVLGMEDQIGAIEPGKKADIIMLDLDQAHLTPFYDEDILVNGARGADVKTVIINGRVVMEDRVFQNIDEKEAMSRVREMAGPLKGAI